MREGVIIQPAGMSIALASSASATPSAPSANRAKSPSVAESRVWTYFATPARAHYWKTAELALRDGVLWRSPRKKGGALLPNVGEVRAGDRIVVAYGARGSYTAIGVFRVLDPVHVVAGTQALAHVEDP